MQTSIKWAIAVCAFGLSLSVPAQVPGVSDFQGRLTSQTGAPLFNATNNVADGQIDLVFRIYDTPTGGTVKWSQTIADVAVYNGLFSVLLTNLSETVFPATTQVNRWLEVEVRTGTATNLLGPRKEIVSVASAIQAGNAWTLDSLRPEQVLNRYAFQAPVAISGTNISFNYRDADFVVSNNLLVIKDRWVDEAGDTMTGPLTMSAGTRIIGTGIIDSQAITNETILNEDIATTANIAASKILVSGIDHGPLTVQTHVSNLWGTIGFVVGQTGNEPFSSVQAAINAATNAGYGQDKPVTIEIKPGIYTENLTFQPGIQLKAEIEDALFSVAVRGTHQYDYNGAGLGDLYISGIWFQSRDIDTDPTFTISGTGYTSIRMNHCVLYSGNNQPVLRLSNTGGEPGRLSNTEMFHCRIRSTLTDFTGSALVELTAGSLLMRRADVSLLDLAERSFLASGTSQLILDNAEIRGRIATTGGAANLFTLIISQSSIDTGNNLPGIEHNAINAAAFEVLFISTQPGPVVAGTGNFLYNNVAYFYSAYGIPQTLPATAVPIRTEIEHRLLRGLAGDDHGQYHNNTRGDARYAGAGWDGTTRLKTAQDHIARRDNPHQVTAAQTGALGINGGLVNGVITLVAPAGNIPMGSFTAR